MILVYMICDLIYWLNQIIENYFYIHKFNLRKLVKKYFGALQHCSIKLKFQAFFLILCFTLV